MGKRIAIAGCCGLIFLVGWVFGVQQSSRPAQEHSQTVAQCRADDAVWGNVNFDEYLKAEDLHRDPHKPNNNNTDLARLPITEVVTRLRTMAACVKIDPKNSRLYNSTMGMYDHVWGRPDG